MSVGATARLSRLLSMAPWLLQRPGVPIEEAARHFGLSEAELVRDLELLFVCGTPGHLPGDLIEADWESGHVYLGNADEIARPLRLGVDESVALLAGLRTLMEVPGLHDRAALAGVLAKLSAAAGEGAERAAALSADLSGGIETEVLATVRAAVAGHRRLRLRYLVTSRDEITDREVDPMRLTSMNGRWYLEGWCHRAEAERLFRLDRVVEAQVLEVDGTPPAEAVARDADEALFRPSPDDLLVTLDLEPSARWVVEYYPVQEVAPRPGGGLRVTLRVATPDWVPRLVLSQGGAVRVIDPPDLVELTRERAEEALGAYS